MSSVAERFGLSSVRQVGTLFFIQKQLYLLTLAQPASGAVSCFGMKFGSGLTLMVSTTTG